LYLILDRQVNTYEELLDIAEQAVSAGADIVQLRAKNESAMEILKFSREILKRIQGKVPYIINDRVDLALAAHANGVHLGQDDIPLKEARVQLGSDAIIGMSCQTQEHVQMAQKDGADYIGLGSIFKTLTKPDRSPMDFDKLKDIVQAVQIPMFAIGGVTRDNMSDLFSVGVGRLAVCRAVCQSADIGQAVRDLKCRRNEVFFG